MQTGRNTEGYPQCLRFRAAMGTADPRAKAAKDGLRMSPPGVDPLVVKAAAARLEEVLREKAILEASIVRHVMGKAERA